MIGSFLNVVIYRLPLRKSVVWPLVGVPALRARADVVREHPGRSAISRSRGRCRTCGAPASACSYPLVEALTAVMFAAAWWYYGPGPLLAVAPDLRLRADRAVRDRSRASPPAECDHAAGHRRRVRVQPVQPARAGCRRSSGSRSGPACCVGIAEAYYRIRHEEGLGMGDVKMLAMIGAFLGWPLTLLTLMLASVSGTVIG